MVGMAASAGELRERKGTMDASPIEMEVRREMEISSAPLFLQL